ncbi:MAG TPA: hypothetical protein PLG34_09785 [Spirochaetota bacterium]|jgi:tetratricopeptide (TPR) repeat protein|nr:MAG: hypothetical protein BWX91_02321 [Spirochaetes bacterium ADurb.Bin133]HNZ26992.1 hypothetical protein [Spirochaetota bacterium]HPY88261.1 hypothetical protein [Spirochaetota bacterium]
MKEIFRSYLFFFVTGIVLLNSCVTGGDKVLVQTIDAESLEMIDKVDLLLLDYKISKDKNKIEEAEKLIGDLESRSLKNKAFEAKVLGLFGEMEYCKGQTINLKSYVGGIEARNKYEERLYILKTYIVGDPVEKEKILLQGIEKADENLKLKLYLGDIYFLSGQFGKATALYDSVFTEISEEYKSYYIKKREISKNFIDKKVVGKNTILSLLKDRITVGDLVATIFDETDLLNAYKSQKIKDGYNNLVNDKFFYDIALTLEKEIKRKDIAFFLLKTLSIKENDPDMINKYVVLPSNERSDAESIVLSPVPDISTRDYFYTAALILVEREIMDLPDGERFFPEDFMSGIEFFGVLKKL